MKYSVSITYPKNNPPRWSIIKKNKSDHLQPVEMAILEGTVVKITIT
jgi:hypothetical protein